MSEVIASINLHFQVSQDIHWSGAARIKKKAGFRQLSLCHDVCVKSSRKINFIFI